MKNYILKPLLISLIILTTFACEDILDVNLGNNQLLLENAFQTPEDLREAVNGAYEVVASTYNGRFQRLSDLLADDIFIEGNANNFVQVFNRASDFFNGEVGGAYDEPYFAIVRSNFILENLDQVAGLSDEDRQLAEGEAKFIRGICHFELVRLFAQPYGFTPDNSHLGIVISTETGITPTTTDVRARTRSTVQEVYNQIISDLTEASALLPNANGAGATSSAAKAFLARVYFQMNDFTNAAQFARDVIDTGGFVFDSELGNRFTGVVSSESIFNIISTGQEDDNSGLFDVYRSDNASPQFRASDNLTGFIGSGDSRSQFIQDSESGTPNSGVFTKFNIDFFNISVINLTELYLIAAESYAELQTEKTAALNFLNQVKARAGVSPLSSDVSFELIISEARRERRIEFAAEGYRLHDLKRRGVQGENIIVRGAPWDCNGMVLQFPASEITLEGFELNPEGGCN